MAIWDVEPQCYFKVKFEYHHKESKNMKWQQGNYYREREVKIWDINWYKYGQVGKAPLKMKNRTAIVSLKQYENVQCTWHHMSRHLSTSPIAAWTSGKSDSAIGNPLIGTVETWTSSEMSEKRLTTWKIKKGNHLQPALLSTPFDIFFAQTELNMRSWSFSVEL